MDHPHDGAAEAALSDAPSPTSTGGSATPWKDGLAGALSSAGASVHIRSWLRTEVDAARWLDGDEDTCSLAASDSDSCDALGKPLVHTSSGALKKFGAPARARHYCRRVALLVLLILPLLAISLQLSTALSTPEGVPHPRRQWPSEAPSQLPLPPPSLQPSQLLKAEDILSLHRTFSVVVHHESALQRLTEEQRALMDADVCNSDTTPLPLSQLPSWTLRVVNESCDTCFDTPTYGTAVAGMPEDMWSGADDDETEKKPAPLPVFATTSAPLGLMGPLLFAMASVTDDVDVAAELRRWPWVTRSYAQLRAGADGGAPRHLIVLGIPSTDQPRRYPLRDAQRVTWLTYREVARAENDFTGALLPLYLFAAAERESKSQRSSLPDVELLTPTAREYATASAQRQGTTIVPADYAQRRVVLHRAWRGVPRSDAAVWESPCAAVKTSVVRVGSVTATSSPLVQLSSALALPVTPAFTAAARYICHASTALWQEALRHRNSVWIDMLIDRKPTSGKTMGMGISWGIPTEVGMSQKTILWLNYAYTAFPDVPYIMKGDDDMYLKVPQYLSDLRYARGGVRRVRNLTAEIPHGGVVPVTQAVNDHEECLYRVWWLYTLDTAYGNGVGYTLDRRLIQASMNPFDQSNAVLLRLVTMPHNSSLDEAYLSLAMQYDDVMVGKQVMGHAEAVQDVCPRHRVCYLVDRETRVHQVRRPGPTKMRWVSTLEHYGMPAIPYYLHYFHKNEFRVAAEAKVALANGANISDVQAKATAQMHDWVRSQVPSTLVGLGSKPDIDWMLGLERVAYVMAEEDEVAVYDVRYRFRKRRGAECVYESISELKAAAAGQSKLHTRAPRQYLSLLHLLSTTLR